MTAWKPQELGILLVSKSPAQAHRTMNVEGFKRTLSAVINKWKQIRKENT